MSDVSLQLGRQFPEPIADWRSTSVVGPGLAHLTGVGDMQGWLVLHSLAVVAAFATIAYLVYRRAPDRDLGRIGIVWVALGPLPPVLLQKIGSYDPYTTMAMAVLVLARGRTSALIAGAVLGLANAEQGAMGLVAAALAAAAMAQTTPSSSRAATLTWLRSPVVTRLALGASALIVIRTGVAVLHAASGVDVPSRGRALEQFAREGAENFVGAGGAGAYAWFGAAWVLIGLAVLLGPWRRVRLVVLGAGLVGVPSVAAILSLDGTRVFAMVALPAFLVLLMAHLDGLSTGSTAVRTLATRVVTAVAIASPLLPALATETGGAGYFAMPWTS